MIRFARAITALNRVLFDLTKWFIFLITILMVYEVVARYSLSAPTSWAPELATLFFGPYFLLGGPYLVHIGGHVAIDIVSERSKGRWRSALVITAQMLAIIFALVLLRFSLPLAQQSFQYGETTYSSWNPILWPSKSFLPIAAMLIILQSVAEIIFHIQSEVEY